MQDEITVAKDGDEVCWAMMTAAKIELHGNVAQLMQDGKTVRVRLLSPQGAGWKIESARPPSAVEIQNAGYSLLTCRVSMRAHEVTQIVEEFLPEMDGSGTDEPEKITPLAAWPGKLGEN